MSYNYSLKHPLLKNLPLGSALVAKRISIYALTEPRKEGPIILPQLWWWRHKRAMLLAIIAVTAFIIAVQFLV